ncbi:MAG: aldo/keto reductase family protein [Gammaproteobacteria bacterium]
MKYGRLGNSDLEVSEIALGSWLTYGVGVEKRRAEECVKRAFDVGINFIDTANVYGRGAAETVLGELLAGYNRNDYVLATKVYFPMSDTDRGLSRAQIHKQIDASLKRLRTDCVDLYQCHRYDVDTPIEETMQALTEVVEAGKARYVGFSEWNAAQISAAYEMPGMVRFVSSQPQYSMLWRRPDSEVIPLCTAHGISQIVWSPLGQGVLTGKYRPGSTPGADTRAGDDKMNPFMGELMEDAVLHAVSELKPVADAAGLSMAQLALAWVLNEQNVASAIIGASRAEQVEENAAASGVELEAETLEEIDRILESVIRR